MPNGSDSAGLKRIQAKEWNTQVQGTHRKTNLSKKKAGKPKYTKRGY